MQIDVSVVLRETIREIAAWRCETDQDKQFLTTDKYEHHDAFVDAWRRLALKINRLADQNPDVQVDVFLILRGHLPENIYDIDALTEVVSHARDYTWGGDIYVAWEQKPEAAFNRLYRGNEKVVEGLLGMLVRSGVTDLIEIQKWRKAAGREEKTILYECALESRERRARLRKLVDGNGWRVILRDGAYFLADFVNDFIRGKLELAEGSNLAVFYDQRPPRGWGQLLRESRLYGRGGKLFVAALCRPGSKDARDLKELWGQESPGLKLFCFNGAFEWLYAFTRLCQASRPPALPSGGSTHGEIVWVESARRTAPGPETNSGDEPRLLVTSAFALHAGGGENPFTGYEGYGPFQAWGEGGRSEGWEEEEYCLTATREIGGVLRHLPFNVEVEVRQRVTCEMMPRFLKGKLFAAWLHLGHGSAAGLREEQIAQDAAPQRWVDCFEDYGAQLRLVIFSACESAELAQLFVESGVSRIAIGFGRKVLTQATHELSEKVIPAALRGAGHRDVVLNAFREAVLVLRRTTITNTRDDDSGIEHYSDSEPKAFAARPERS
jgi:hypothetical protein